MKINHFCVIEAKTLNVVVGFKSGDNYIKVVKNMNRPIKFRVWDIQNNNWAYQLNLAAAGEPMVKMDGIAGWTANLHTFRPEVNYIFQQFTGLHSMDDKSIYEGDVIQYNQNSSYTGMNFVVKWSNDMSGWIMQSNSGDCLINEWTPNGDRFKFLEIVGNINENPNLQKLA